MSDFFHKYHLDDYDEKKKYPSAYICAEDKIKSYV